jgi:hypothetical protein
MTTKKAGLVLATLVLGVMLSPLAFAEPPADKGKGADASQPTKQDMGGQSAADARDDKGNDRGASDQPHGEVVSECNHRANERNLKGRDRKQFVEWCTDRGERYGYDDRRFDEERSCYRKADDRGLSGDFRRVFLQDCLGKQEKRRENR